MKPQKFLLTSLLAAAAMSAVPAYGDAAYTSTTTGVGTTLATMQLDGDTTTVLAGSNINLGNFSGTLELSGNNGGSISTVATNGGWGGRVSFAENSYTSELTRIILNAGIEAELTNVASQSGLTIEADNASFYFTGDTLSANLHVGSGGVRLNGNSGATQTYAGTITGSGNVYNFLSQSTNGSVIFTGNTSGFTGTWVSANDSAKIWQFGDGSAAAAGGAVGGNFGTRTQRVKLKFNFTGDYSVGGNVYASALTIAGGNASFGGAVKAGSISVASGATAKLAEGSAFNLASVASAIAISGGGNFVLAGNVSLSADASGAPLSLTAGTFSVEDTASFALTGAGRLGESVNFVSVSGGTVTAATLSTEKFTYNGHALSSRVTGVSLTESGSLAFTGKALSLTWKSDLTTGTWNKSNQNFTASDGTASSFVDYDDVTFATAGASVTIGEPIAAERITISEDTTFTASSSNTLSASNVAVESGKTLTISGSGGISNYSFGSVDVAENAVWDLGTYGSVAVSQTVTGSGTVKIVNSSGGHSVTVNLGEFSGILDFTGKFKSDGNTLGTDATIRISGSGANCNMWGGGTLANDVHFLTDYQIGDSTSTSITLSGRVSTEEGTTLTVGATRSGYTGTAIFSGGMDVSHLLVNDYGVAQIRNNAADSGSSKKLNKVTLANGRTLTLYSAAQPTVATTIGELALSGATATLAMTHFQGYWNVDKLDIGEQTSVTLNLASSQSSSNTGIFELGASSASDVGNFAGTFNVTSTDTGKTRSVSVVISNGDIAKKAVVKLASIGSAASSTIPSRLSLGVNASRVTIAGLVSTLGDNAGVYSGKVGTETDGASIPAGDSTTRTLVINTAEGGDYSFNGKILANLNLEKTGAGTQTLAGASTAFNGSVKVSGGVLALADASAIGSGNAVRIDGGQLKVGNGTTAVSLNAAAYTIVLSDAYSEDSGVAAIVGTDTANKSSVALATDTKITIELADSVAVSLAAEAAQYQYKIFDTATIVSDSFTIDSFALSEALKSDWQISGYKNGVLTIAAIPEPSVFGLLAGLGALALAGTRRRRRKA